MTTTVVTVPETMSLRGAARLLSHASITGAPVVDHSGRCVGVLSATDFLAWTDRGEYAAKRSGTQLCTAHSAWQVLDEDTIPVDEVHRFMTADPVKVEPATPVGELAQMMLDAHIHRVIVVDEHDKPVGIVSSTDILAAVVHACKKPVFLHG